MKFALLEISACQYLSHVLEEVTEFEYVFLELVLSVLISRFEFENAMEEIDWRMGITVVPYVKGKQSEGPHVPMKLKLVPSVPAISE